MGIGGHRLVLRFEMSRLRNRLPAHTRPPVVLWALATGLVLACGSEGQPAWIETASEELPAILAASDSRAAEEALRDAETPFSDHARWFLIELYDELNAQTEPSERQVSVGTAEVVFVGDEANKFRVVLVTIGAPGGFNGLPLPDGGGVTGAAVLCLFDDAGEIEVRSAAPLACGSEGQPAWIETASEELPAILAASDSRAAEEALRDAETPFSDHARWFLIELYDELNAQTEPSERQVSVGTAEVVFVGDEANKFRVVLVTIGAPGGFNGLPLPDGGGVTGTALLCLFDDAGEIEVRSAAPLAEC